MQPLQQRLYDEIRRIPLIDPHTHVDPQAPVGRRLDDLLGYHYYTELAHSAGMDSSLVAPGAPPERRVEAIARFLPTIENTAQYSWLMDIAHSLLGFAPDRVDASTIGDLVDLAAAKMADPDWERTVLRESNLERVFLTNDFDDALGGFDTDRYVPCLRADELVFKLDQPGVRERLARCSGVQAGDAASLDRALAAVFGHFTSHGARAAAIGLPPDFAPRPQADAAADAALKSLAAGREVSADQLAALAHWTFWRIAGLCVEHALPLDLMIGAVRGVYPAGVHQGRDLFNRLTSLHQYEALFNAFGRARFPVSIIDSGQNPELVAFSWIFPNVFTCGHWWYANIPPLIDRDLRQRLSAVPRTKQIGYYSDAYKLEFCLPKFNMYRRVLAGVLADDFVVGRGWSEEKAVALAHDVLRGNVERVFYGDRGAS